MAKQVRCKTCRSQFTPAQGTARVNCYTCRPPRKGPGGIASAVTVPVDPVKREPGEIEIATRAELERAGRLVTVSGAIAVRLAHAMDDPALPEARLSSLASQLERTMERATAGVKAPPDELTQRQARIRAVAESA